jgi:hypothetical protein
LLLTIFSNGPDFIAWAPLCCPRPSDLEGVTSFNDCKYKSAPNLGRFFFLFIQSPLVCCCVYNQLRNKKKTVGVLFFLS